MYQSWQTQGCRKRACCVFSLNCYSVPWDHALTFPGLHFLFFIFYCLSLSWSLPVVLLHLITLPLMMPFESFSPHVSLCTLWFVFSCYCEWKWFIWKHIKLFTLPLGVYPCLQTTGSSKITPEQKSYFPLLSLTRLTHGLRLGFRQLSRWIKILSVWIHINRVAKVNTFNICAASLAHRSVLTETWLFNIANDLFFSSCLT